MENNVDIIKSMEEFKKPTLSDPKEFAIVKSVYFYKDISFDEKEVDERISRAHSRRKNLNNQSR